MIPLALECCCVVSLAAACLKATEWMESCRTALCWPQIQLRDLAGYHRVLTAQGARGLPLQLYMAMERLEHSGRVLAKENSN